STATFTYAVMNTGNVPLTCVEVYDDELGAITHLVSNGNGDQVLHVGETWFFTATRIVTPGQYANTGKVSAKDPLQDEVCDTDASHHFGVDSAIRLEKLTDGDDADTPTGPLLPVGSTATFTYIVTNTGNVPLMNVQVTDDQLGVITNLVNNGNGDA